MQCFACHSIRSAHPPVPQDALTLEPFLYHAKYYYFRHSHIRCRSFWCVPVGVRPALRHTSWDQLSSNLVYMIDDVYKLVRQSIHIFRHQTHRSWRWHSFAGVCQKRNIGIPLPRWVRICRSCDALSNSIFLGTKPIYSNIFRIASNKHCWFSAGNICTNDTPLFRACLASWFNGLKLLYVAFQRMERWLEWRENTWRGTFIQVT